MRRTGVMIVVIGIGSNIDIPSMKATSGEANYYGASSFTELVTDAFISDITTATCETSIHAFISFFFRFILLFYSRGSRKESLMENIEWKVGNRKGPESWKNRNYDFFGPKIFLTGCSGCSGCSGLQWL